MASESGVSCRQRARSSSGVSARHAPSAEAIDVRTGRTQPHSPSGVRSTARVNCDVSCHGLKLARRTGRACGWVDLVTMRRKCGMRPRLRMQAFHHRFERLLVRLVHGGVEEPPALRAPDRHLEHVHRPLASIPRDLACTQRSRVVTPSSAPHLKAPTLGRRTRVVRGWAAAGGAWFTGSENVVLTPVPELIYPDDPVEVPVLEKTGATHAI
jgi:hypothetical protein